jgi:signal transduction histidine kinase
MHGRIDLDVFAHPDQASFSVTDDGPGVDEAVVDRLFEPFFTTKGSEKGTGLGLSIVAMVVRDHGGRIEYRRCPGRGAQFVVTLPRKDDGRSER